MWLAALYKSEAVLNSTSHLLILQALMIGVFLPQSSTIFVEPYGTRFLKGSRGLSKQGNNADSWGCFVASRADRNTD